MQTAEGLIGLEEADLARFYLDQAFILAGRSPFLQIVHRRAIFERLQRNYIALGDRKQARTSLDLSANPPDVAFIVGEGPILPRNEPSRCRYPFRQPRPIAGLGPKVSCIIG